jgi:hypothetical protein
MIDARFGSNAGLAGAMALLVALAAVPCPAIEMFTFFGDGSRIGLPSLEVPVEAYRGIPLRSDRLRARRVTRRPANAASTTPSGAMIQVIPETVVPNQSIDPPPAPRGIPRGTAGQPQGGRPMPPSAGPSSAGPIAPEPPVATGAMPAAERIPTPGTDAR